MTFPFRRTPPQTACCGAPIRAGRRFMLRLAALLLILSQIATLCGADDSAKVRTPHQPQALTVVLDQDYPPYVIPTPSGGVQGILVDLWKRWEQQTGVPVTLVPMEWDAAQDFMRQGKADVIDMLFENAARRKAYILSKPYAVIDVPIFVHQDLAGIHDIASLRGFPVAVKRGDANVDRLTQLGVGPLLYYDNYEDVIRAAKDGKIKVFCIDAPPALYYLYKFRLDDEFRLAFTLYSGEFHRGVRKTDDALMRFIEDGFDRIPKDQKDAIEMKWRGTPLLPSGSLRYGLWGMITLATAAAILLSTNAVLRRRVRRQTTRLEDLLAAVGQSERRYRELVESAESVILRLDLLGRVAFCNTCGQRVLGLPLGRMLGRDIGQLCDAPAEAASPSWRDILDALAEDPMGARSLDRRHIGAQGRTIWIAWSLRLLRDSKGHNDEVLCVGNEITARKRTEEALASSEARYALVARASNDGIWDWDLDTNRVYYSPRYLEMLGLSPDKGTQPSSPEEWRDRIHPDDAAMVQRANKRCADGVVDHFDVEYRVRHEDGSYRWILGRGASLKDAHGRVVRMAGSHTDITRRKKDETFLRESQDQLAKIFRLSPVGIAVSTRRDGRIVDVNASGARMFGYDKTEVIGRTSREIGLWSRPEDRQAQLDTIAAEGSIRGKELELRHKNGSPVVILYSAVPIQAYGDSCLLTVLVDITERKAMEQALRRSKEAAEAANRAKSDFLSSMSHEIRTPMSTILTMTKVLAAAPLPQNQAQAVRAVESAGSSLLALLNDVLDLSQIESGGVIIEEKPCDIAALSRQLVDMMQPDAGRKGLALRLEIFEPPPPHISLNPDRIRQVLLNLLGNAIKFTHNGSVVLEIGRTEDPRTGAWLRLAVRDTGIGIPADRLPVIFDRFTQADAAISRLYGGVGLGLAISKRLVDMMGGHITVDTEEGRGSVFTLLLPLRPVVAAAGENAPQAADPAGAGLAGQQQVAVLLIENNPGNAEVTRLMLQDTPYSLTWAPSNQAGLVAFRDAPCDIVLLGEETPGTDPFGTAASLRRLEQDSGRPRTPLLLLTVRDSEEYRQQALTAGYDDILIRPVTRPKLRDTLAAWMAVAGH